MKNQKLDALVNEANQARQEFKKLAVKYIEIRKERSKPADIERALSDARKEAEASYLETMDDSAFQKLAEKEKQMVAAVNNRASIQRMTEKAMMEKAQEADRKAQAADEVAKAEWGAIAEDKVPALKQAILAASIELAYIQWKHHSPNYDNEQMLDGIDNHRLIKQFDDLVGEWVGRNRAELPALALPVHNKQGFVRDVVATLPEVQRVEVYYSPIHGIERCAIRALRIADERNDGRFHPFPTV